MPRLSHNEFLTRNPKPIAIGFTFLDFAALKKRAKGKPLKFRNGKVLPSPSAVVKGLASSILKGDYSIEAKGYHAIVMIADDADAKALQSKAGGAPFKKGDGQPYRAVSAVGVNMDCHLQWSTQLKLL